MTYVGQSLLRKEDLRLLRGEGRYAADVQLGGILHMAVLRSPHAHARIRRVDLSAACLAPGVVDVLAYANVPAFSRPIPIRMSPLESMQRFLQRPLADTKVRYVGEPVAVVLADSRYSAEDAIELIEVDYEELPPVLDARAGAEPGAAILADDQGTNIAARYVVANGDVDEALREADVVVRTSFKTQRHSGVPLETRGLVASWEPGRRLTMWGVTKVPFFNRGVIAEFLGLPEHMVHFVQTDVGGAFGIRGELYPEDFLLAALAVRAKRPVQWIEDRKEHLLAANHSREQWHEAAIGVRRDGTITGIHTRFWVDMGAYIRTHGATVPNNTAGYLPGPYRIPNYRADVTCVLTNKTPTGTYRGPGRFEANFVRERLLDMAAEAIGMEPAEIRRRNFVLPEAMPYEVGTATLGRKVVYDAGSYQQLFDRALERFDFEGARCEQRQAREQGRLVGLGIGFLVEKSGLGPWESARVFVGSSGAVHVVSGIPSIGQGVETAFAQICADALGVPYETVTVSGGDTDLIPYGIGAFASRGTVLGGSAVHQAALLVREKALAVAAHTLEVHVDDLEMNDGIARVKGAPERSMTLAQVAKAATPTLALKAGFEPGLEALELFQLEKMTYGYGVHLVQVEVDPETGEAAIRRYLVDYDIGKAINPRLVEGQVVGGTAQGIGGALLEEFAYDDQGQLLTGTFVDYLLPSATDVPRVETHIAEDCPSALNPLGVKGAGEGGTVAAGAAVANAVADALAPLGVSVTTLPLSPDRVRKLIREAASRTSTVNL